MNVGIEPTKNEVSTQMTITIVYVSKKNNQENNRKRIKVITSKIYIRSISFLDYSIIFHFVAGEGIEPPTFRLWT